MVRSSLLTSSGLVMFLAALDSFQPSVLHHFEMVTLDMPVFNAISCCSIPERYSVLASDFLFSNSALFILSDFGANMSENPLSGKIVCIGCIQVCNHCTLFLMTVSVRLNLLKNQRI